MSLKIEIKDMVGEAFEDKPEEVARILEVITKNIKCNGLPDSLRLNDLNGNSVGELVYEENMSDEKTELLAEDSFKVEISDMDNDAFEDKDFEVVRILDVVIKNIRINGLPDSLRLHDLNGNNVGEVNYAEPEMNKDYLSDEEISDISSDIETNVDSMYEYNDVVFNKESNNDDVDDAIFYIEEAMSSSKDLLESLESCDDFFPDGISAIEDIDKYLKISSNARPNIKDLCDSIQSVKNDLDNQVLNKRMGY